MGKRRRELPRNLNDFHMDTLTDSMLERSSVEDTSQPVELIKNENLEIPQLPSKYDLVNLLKKA